MSSSRQRLLFAGLAIAAILAVVAAVLIAGSSGTDPDLTTSTDQTLTTSAVDTSLGSTVPPTSNGESTTAPSGSAGPSTTRPTSTDAPVVTPAPPVQAETDCGIVYLASGWPTTTAPSPTFASCLATGFTAGTPTRLVVRAQTDGAGGHILITTYQVLGPASVRVTEDATNAADRPQVVTVKTCTGLTVSGSSISESGCT
jgi:hypothetical protein